MLAPEDLASVSSLISFPIKADTQQRRTTLAAYIWRLCRLTGTIIGAGGLNFVKTAVSPSTLPHADLVAPQTPKARASTGPSHLLLLLCTSQQKCFVPLLTRFMSLFKHYLIRHPFTGREKLCPLLLLLTLYLSSQYVSLPQCRNIFCFICFFTLWFLYWIVNTTKVGKICMLTKNKLFNIVQFYTLRPQNGVLHVENP